MRPIRIKEAERILLLMSDPGQTSCSAAAEFGQSLDHGVENPGMSDDDRFGRFFFGISHAAIGTARYLWRTSGEYASTRFRARSSFLWVPPLTTTRECRRSRHADVFQAGSGFLMAADQDVPDQNSPRPAVSVALLMSRE